MGPLSGNIQTSAMVKHVVTEQMPRACVAHTLTAPDREENVRTQRNSQMRKCIQPVEMLAVLIR
jgi:hypothetical protein